MEVIEAVRAKKGPSFPIGAQLNSCNELEGGLTEEDSLLIFEALTAAGKVDVIDVSGGTYFEQCHVNPPSVGL